MEQALSDLLQQIDRKKSEVDSLRPFNAEQEGRIMQKFRLDWNYHSNAIEGNSLTYGETVAFLMEGLTAKGKPFKDHLDLRGHNEVIDYLLDLIKNRERISEKMIREMHQMLLVEPYTTKAQTPDGRQVEKQVSLGAYKTMPNHVKTPTGAVHYYASPEETPAKMTELVAWLRKEQSENGLHPLLIAATFHYRFVAIHPFDDGNGRMSRLLMNLILMEYGFPPVVIKQQDRNQYYNALRQADAGDIREFLAYVGQNLLHSLDIQLKGARSESLEEAGDLDKEIALLKKSLVENEAIPQSQEIMHQLLTQEIIPLIKEIQNQCHKLDDLFFKHSDQIKYAFTNGIDKISQSPVDWDNMEREILPHKYRGSLTLLDYEYMWSEFRKAKSPFNVQRVLKIRFEKFNFELSLDGYKKLVISKTYSQRLTPEERKLCSEWFVKEALQQIKSATGQ